MPRDDHQHRFPFPPQGDPFAPFPRQVPWDTPISELASWWLYTECGTDGRSAYYPLRLMAAERGWNVTLRQIVPRLVCSHCGARPAVLRLVDNASGEDGRAGGKVMFHDLLAG